MHAIDEAYRGGGGADHESLPPGRRAAIVCAVEQERSRLALESVAPTKPKTQRGHALRIYFVNVLERTDWHRRPASRVV